MFGIQLAVHASFLLLLAYYGYEGWNEGRLPGMFWSIGLIVLFFVCVILHELGHSLTARRYGVRVPRILLLPIGGMAEFDRIPRKPSEELWITVAGPAVNFAIFALLLPLVWRSLFSDQELPEYSASRLLVQLCVANLGMGVFNLLPVFPMDGGRIFRALLAMKLPYLRATYWAAKIGKILALALAVGAAFYFKQPIMCLLFLFILWAGDAEYKYTVRREEQDKYWEAMSRPLNPIGTNPPEPPLLVQEPR